MKQIEQLKAAAKRALEGARAIVAAADKDTRGMTAAELADYETRMQEFEALELAIREAESRGGTGAAAGDRALAARTDDGRMGGDEFRGRGFLPSMREYRALASGTDSAGGVLVPVDTSKQVFDRLRPASVVLSAGCTVIPIDRETTLPVIGASVTAAFVAENGEISASDMTFAGKTLTPRKLSALQRASNELLQDSMPEARKVIEFDLVKKLAEALDSAFIAGDGNAPNPRGLRNTQSANVVYMGTDGGVLTLDAILQAIGRLEAANAKPGAILMHPRDFQNLKAAKTGISGDNRYLIAADPSGAFNKSLFGVPVFTSSQVPTNEVRGGSGAVCSSVIVFDPSQVVIGRRQDVQVLYDTSRYFEFDQTAIRATTRWDLAVLNAAAVEIIAGCKAS